jgi:hypothetical protein
MPTHIHPEVCTGATPETIELVLRKLIWTGLYAGITALAAMMARKTAGRLWRIATGEEPPARKA